MTISKLAFSTPTLALPLRRLCRNQENALFVILNEVKNLIISTESTGEILRLWPQNDIATHSLKGEVRRGIGFAMIIETR
jgi:hypothetical protein